MTSSRDQREDESVTTEDDDEGENDEAATPLLSPQSCPPSTPTQQEAQLAIIALAGCTNFLVYTYISCLGPFFPAYAKSAYGSSAIEIGVVFCLYPLAQGLASPLASSLCERLGRLVIWTFGLVLLSGNGDTPHAQIVAAVMIMTMACYSRHHLGQVS